MGENMNKQELIHQIKIWLKEAAEKSRAVQIKTLKVDQKTNRKDLVTNMDREVQAFLIEKIQAYNPEAKILAEEEGYSELESFEGQVFVIDPIDGTSYYVNNTLFWGIQLAFYDKGKTKFSIIYLPKLKQFYYAFSNHGAYLNNNKILISSNIKDLNRCIVEFGGSIYKEIAEKKFYLSKLIKDDQMLVSNIMHINSSCVSYTNLASEKTDALIASTKKLWDIMPGEFLLEVVGFVGYSMDFEGKLKLFTKNKKIIELLLTINNK